MPGRTYGTEYEVDLDPEGTPEREWIRLRIATEKGNVVAFTVQYETTIEGQRFPIVRYDTEYDRPHRDLLDRRGRVVKKTWLPEDMTYDDALQVGNRDIRANWRRYREAFGGEAP